MFVTLAELDPSALEGQPFWQQVLYAVVVSVVSLFVLPYLKRLNEKARAEAEAANQTIREKLLSRVKSIALDQAYVIGQERFPKIAQWIFTNKEGKPGLQTIKDELRSWGQDLKKHIVAYFKNEGIDIVGEIGDDYLDQIVRWAADKVSPFPGKETAVQLLTDDWTNKLADFGVDWVRDNWLKQDGSNPPAKPAPAK